MQNDYLGVLNSIMKIANLEFSEIHALTKLL